MNRDAEANPIDLAAVRARLAGRQGKEYWKSLEQVASTPEFEEFLYREFPEGASELPQGFNRRRFLQLMGASFALAGLAACGRPPKTKIMPYAQGPEQVIPGKPLFYATAIPSFGGIAQGVLVESHTGRPTKIEGNAEHPGSLGATDVFTQASILTMYDPDRSQVMRRRGSLTTWDALLAEARPRIESLKPKKGEGLRILTETVTSPTLAHEIGQVLEQFPAAKWHQYEPLHRDNEYEGAMLAYGEPLSHRFHIERAEVILCLGGDLLGRTPGQLRYARKFISRRKMTDGQKAMNRLYSLESSPSMTGGIADHRLRLRSAEIGIFAYLLAKELGVAVEAPAGPGLPAAAARWIGVVARDLKRNRGKSLITAGEEQPPAVHALVHAMNHALGNVGATVAFSDPVEAKPVNQLASLKELVGDMEAGKVDVLIIAGGNPVFDAPADIPFDKGLAEVGLRIRLGLYEDETSALCDWHIPQVHALESWGDARAFDGTVTILQPLILPLYDGKTPLELLDGLFGNGGRPDDEIVRSYWKSRFPAGQFETAWKRSLHDGLVAGSALAEKTVSLKELKLPAPATASSEGLELAFLPDPTIGDGRFANNGWLQETPKTMTTLTWDNAAMISPATAQRLALQSGDVVELKFEGHSLRAPVSVIPGQGDGTVTIHFGYGRMRAGHVGTGIGFNAYRLRTTRSPWFGAGLQVVKTGERYPLATTQNHHTMEGRNLIRTATLAEFLKNPHFVREGDEGGGNGLSLYPGYEYTGHAWGMAVDLNACIGCNACTVACQAENNIPVVGKEQVIAGREMNWLRVDRYYQGPIDEPVLDHQPVLCMQCENAPCEVVCPVGATTHSVEGLNEMTYNRCVGTRYCSNNCPFKVRRFNFLQFHDTESKTLEMMRNPNVTVRMRGVMEKCTYCVQRINQARIQSELEDRDIRDGEIVTACQAACPTGVFSFGDINDPKSAVSRLKKNPRNYTILDSTNVRPRTSYLARLRNPNPELEEA